MKKLTNNKPLKIYFVGYALAHYFNDFLNKLQSHCNAKITVFTYKESERFIGEGVYQTFDNIDFKVIELQNTTERIANYYPRFEIGKFKSPSYNYLNGLDTYISSNHPDIIVASGAYMQMYLYNNSIKSAIRKANTKLVFRTIPFQQLSYDVLLAQESKYLKPLELNSLPRLLRYFTETLGIDKLYYNKVRKRTLLRNVYSKRKLFNFPDAHACYVPSGIKIYTSYGVPNHKIHIMLNSPDTDKLLNQNNIVNNYENFKKDPFRIVHVGRLIKRKKVDLLLKALRETQKIEPRLNLVIIGNGPEKEDLKNLTKELELSSSVNFKGGVYDPLELAQEMKQASVYVLAGMGGLSLNEAMCFELPIICSVCDGSEEYLVKHGENGYIFKEDDENDLSQKILKILMNPSLQKQMSKNSIEIIEEEINIHTVCENYKNLFYSLVK